MDLKMWEVRSFVETAENKVLGTRLGSGVNVIPVSSLIVYKGQIWLYNYYMTDTVTALKSWPEATLTVWTGMSGYKLFCDADYYTGGDLYERAVIDLGEKSLGREIKGVIILKPFKIKALTD